MEAPIREAHKPLRATDDILRSLLSWALLASRSDRAYLAVRGAPGTKADITVMVTASPEDSRSVSQTVVDEALAIRPSLACLDTTVHRALSRGDSVRQLAFHSVIGAALPTTCPVEGAILLDSRKRPAASESRLRGLVESLAALAGIVLGGDRGTELKRGATRLGPKRSTRATPSAGSVERTQWIRRVATAQLPALVHGETGSGKERVAAEIHRSSPRHRGPFVAINCAAFSDNLLDAELFGAVRGAYTGADRDRPGVFERADGGTLFLDEVGDMPQAMQAKLLRVLESRRVLPVGAAREREVNVRLVTATHRDLRVLVRRDAFRLDLFHRLAVLEIHVPPLRDRLDELPSLVKALEPRLATETQCGPLRLSDGAWDALAAYDWPGNIRELHGVLARALLRAQGATILQRDLDLGPLPRPTAEGSMERAMIQRALHASPGNLAHAARRIGWTRQKLYRRMQALGVRKEAQP